MCSDSLLLPFTASGMPQQHKAGWQNACESVKGKVQVAKVTPYTHAVIFCENTDEADKKQSEPWLPVVVKAN